MTACPVCRDTGIVQCAETDPEDGVYETACPEKVHDTESRCPVCGANQGTVLCDGCKFETCRACNYPCACGGDRDDEITWSGDDWAGRPRDPEDPGPEEPF